MTIRLPYAIAILLAFLGCLLWLATVFPTVWVRAAAGWCWGAALGSLGIGVWWARHRA